jgi:regulator of protease activity HflC (stomatin/prohibitin superfamily)
MKKVSLFLVAISMLFVFFACNERIDAGHEGILVKDYGSEKGVQDIILVTGRVWYNPFTERVHEIPTFVQTIDYPPFSVNAKDGSVFNVDPTVSLSVNPGQSPRIFAKYRRPINEIISGTLYNYTRDAFRIQFNQYSTDSIISNRQSFEDRVQIALSEALHKEGFNLEQMTSGLKYPDVIVDAVNAKNKAVQQAMQVENELRVAEAQAKKKIVEAQAEATANDLRQRTLTPLLIQQQFIEKWDGKSSLFANSPQFFKEVK